MFFNANGTVELRYGGNPLADLNATLYRTIDEASDVGPLFVYRVGDSELTEVLPYVPKTICGDWDEAVRQWFNSADISKVLVRSCDPLPEYAAGENETVELMEMSRTGEYMKFFINSKHPIPLYIKVSEFPNWKAYVNGQPARIYTASPYMMLVYGTGVIEFRYEPVFADYLGGFLSLAGVCWALYMVLYPRLKNKKGPGIMRRPVKRDAVETRRKRVQKSDT
jgi:hypothetical protein